MDFIYTEIKTDDVILSMEKQILTSQKCLKRGFCIANKRGS